MKLHSGILLLSIPFFQTWLLMIKYIFIPFFNSLKNIMNQIYYAWIKMPYNSYSPLIEYSFEKRIIKEFHEINFHH